MRNSKSLRDFIEEVGYAEDWDMFYIRLKGKIKGESQLLSLWFSYKIAKFTRIFTHDVRDFFFENMSYREISEKYGIHEAVIKNNIYRQVRKYYDLIGRDLYKDILNGVISEQEAAVYVEDLKKKYESLPKLENRLEDYFYEDIFSGSRLDHDFSTITQEEFLEARDKISRLCKPATQFLIQNLDSKLKDYVVYLLKTDSRYLSEVDRERKENLVLFFKLEDIIKL